PRLTRAAPLRRFDLVELREEPGQRSTSLLGSSLRLEPRVVCFLLDNDAVDDRLQPYARMATPAVSVDELVFPETFRRQLSQLAEHARTVGHPWLGAEFVLYFQGPYGAGKRIAAPACCQPLGRPPSI